MTIAHVIAPLIQRRVGAPLAERQAVLVGPALVAATLDEHELVGGEPRSLQYHLEQDG